MTIFAVDYFILRIDLSPSSHSPLMYDSVEGHNILFFIVFVHEQEWLEVESQAEIESLPYESDPQIKASTRTSTFL